MKIFSNYMHIIWKAFFKLDTLGKCGGDDILTCSEKGPLGKKDGESLP